MYQDPNCLIIGDCGSQLNSDHLIKWYPAWKKDEENFNVQHI